MRRAKHLYAYGIENEEVVAMISIFSIVENSYPCQPVLRLRYCTYESKYHKYCRLFHLFKISLFHFLLLRQIANTFQYKVHG